jgi:hypothetical protein
MSDKQLVIGLVLCGAGFVVIVVIAVLTFPELP